MTETKKADRMEPLLEGFRTVGLLIGQPPFPKEGLLFI
jgi:hypothetical protein